MIEPPGFQPHAFGIASGTAVPTYATYPGGRPRVATLTTASDAGGIVQECRAKLINETPVWVSE